MKSKNNFYSLANFFHLCEKLKTEKRYGKTSNGENDIVASHSWRMAVIAMLLAPFLEKKINLLKTLKLTLLHDMPEIITGDDPYFCHAFNKNSALEKSKREKIAIKKLASYLPLVNRKEFLNLEKEYELQKTYESRVAKAIDKMEAHMQHNEADISVWNKFDREHYKTAFDKFCDFDASLKKLKEILRDESTKKLKKGDATRGIHPISNAITDLIGKNNNILQNLDFLTSSLSGYFWWKDIDGHYLGGSSTTEKIIGMKREEVIGKTDYDLPWKDYAKSFEENDRKAIETKTSVVAEEKILLHGKERILLVIKSPLIDKNNKVIGTFGSAIDVTDHRQAETLLIETKLQKAKIQEQEKFGLIASQVAHDIRSPLASLSMIIESCKNIPETQRIALRDVATSIGDIASNLVSTSKTLHHTITKPKETQYVLLSLALADILSEKKYQYKKLPIKFVYNVALNDNFLFIKTNLVNFNRMISNLINNAVEAFEGKSGVVSLKLSEERGEAKIIIKDNGKGIPKNVLDKINKNIPITSGKIGGSGIGYTQILQTLKENLGKIAIESTIGKGTTITLTIPLAGYPNWIAKQLVLYKGDTVVILDDDDSIHKAWELRFKNFNNITLKHFKIDDQAVNFINSFPQKSKLFLLTDFELINQNLNGLQVIKKTSQDRAILVTSHYTNPKVLELATKAGIKVLPKQLASRIPIKLETEKQKVIVSNPKKISLVIIDDNQLLADSIADFFRNKSFSVDVYYSPIKFLKKFKQYSKNTKFCIDHDFKSKITGLELAKKLKKAGYSHLYLLSGTAFDNNKMPKYLKVLLKGDTDALSKIIS